jgi:hypothetical protein
MHTTLTIKDLSTSIELDAKAMTAVLGGDGNQANGTSQMNVQSMAALANIGNGSLFGGPATIQSDNTFTQTATNYSEADNFKGLSIGFGPEVLRAFAL